MAYIAIISNDFLVAALEDAGHVVRRIRPSPPERGGLSSHDAVCVAKCDCLILETSPMGYGYLEAGVVAGSGRPVFMIPTHGDVLTSHRTLGVRSVDSLDNLLNDLSSLKG